MWLFSMFPEGLSQFIVYVLIIGGFASIFLGTFTSVVPGVSQYALVLKIAGLISVVVGVYLAGGNSAMEVQREKIAKLEKEIKESEKKSAEAVVRIDEILKLKNKKIIEAKVVIQDRIVKVAEQIDAKCTITPEFVTELNMAAQMPTEPK